jgi:hypothetical protein
MESYRLRLSFPPLPFSVKSEEKRMEEFNMSFSFFCFFCYFSFSSSLHYMPPLFHMKEVCMYVITL